LRRESTSSPITSIASVAAAVFNRIESIGEEVASRATGGSNEPRAEQPTTSSASTSSDPQQQQPSISEESTSSTSPLISQQQPQTNEQPQLETQSSLSTAAHSVTSMSVRDETESMETDNSESSEGSAPREVGHNLYILAHKLAKFNKELSVLVKSKDSEALSYYAAHTAQIEVINMIINYDT
jgi:hypothetical protein